MSLILMAAVSAHNKTYPTEVTLTLWRDIVGYWDKVSDALHHRRQEAFSIKMIEGAETIEYAPTCRFELSRWFVAVFTDPTQTIFIKNGETEEQIWPAP